MNNVIDLFKSDEFVKRRIEVAVRKEHGDKDGQLFIDQCPEFINKLVAYHQSLMKVTEKEPTNEK